MPLVVRVLRIQENVQLALNSAGLLLIVFDPELCFAPPADLLIQFRADPRRGEQCDRRCRWPACGRNRRRSRHQNWNGAGSFEGCVLEDGDAGPSRVGGASRPRRRPDSTARRARCRTGRRALRFVKLQPDRSRPRKLPDRRQNEILHLPHMGDAVRSEGDTVT